MVSKAQDAFRTISEVADWLDVPPHVLRYWESKFPQIKPVKRAGGRRYYRPADMQIVGGIKALLHDEGLSIRLVQQKIREEGVKAITSLAPVVADEDDDQDGALTSTLPQGMSNIPAAMAMDSASQDRRGFQEEEAPHEHTSEAETRRAASSRDSERFESHGPYGEESDAQSATSEGPKPDADDTGGASGSVDGMSRRERRRLRLEQRAAQLDGGNGMEPSVSSAPPFSGPSVPPPEPTQPHAPDPVAAFGDDEAEEHVTPIDDVIDDFAAIASDARHEGHEPSSIDTPQDVEASDSIEDSPTQDDPEPETSSEGEGSSAALDPNELEAWRLEDGAGAELDDPDEEVARDLFSSLEPEAPSLHPKEPSAEDGDADDTPPAPVSVDPVDAWLEDARSESLADDLGFDDADAHVQTPEEAALDDDVASLQTADDTDPVPLLQEPSGSDPDASDLRATEQSGPDPVADESPVADDASVLHPDEHLEALEPDSPELGDTAQDPLHAEQMESDKAIDTTQADPVSQAPDPRADTAEHLIDAPEPNDDTERNKQASAEEGVAADHPPEPEVEKDAHGIDLNAALSPAGVARLRTLRALRQSEPELLSEVPSLDGLYRKIQALRQQLRS